MPPLSEKELEKRLTATGKSLANPPSSPDQLLALLDRVEELLSVVEQSPPKSIQTALSPLIEGLVSEVLLKHSDNDVRVGVASCISEITRITAPNAPYDDDKMKEVFQLIVSSFENLSDISSRSHAKRAIILETMAKIRSCVIMLDLECDRMIIDMFQYFLKATRSYHDEIIFTYMEAIMTLVVEESEDISTDLSAVLLATLKRNNQDVTPIARKLAEKVIKKSANKLRPYLKQAVTSLKTSCDDYSEVLASLCPDNTGPVGHGTESILKNQLAAEDDGEGTNFQNKDSIAIRPPNSESNGTNEIGMNEIMAKANTAKRADSENQYNSNSTFKVESDDDHDAMKHVKLEAKAEQAQQEVENLDIPDKDVHISVSEVKPVEANESLDKLEDKSVEVVTEASTAQSGSVPDESLSETKIKGKSEEKLVHEDTVSVDAVSKKSLEEESEAKKRWCSGKKRTDDSADMDKALTEEVAPKNDGSESGSEARSPDQAEKLRNASNKTEFGSSVRKQNGKKSGRRKSVFRKEAPKSSAKEDHEKAMSTPRASQLKSTKHRVVEETPRSSTKRKQIPGKEKVSESPEYGKNLVGSKVKVWWPKDRAFYEGVIESFDSIKKKHKVLYNDGEEEILNLTKERWGFLENDVILDGEQDAEHSSHGTSSDVQVKRKKRQKMEGSPKSKQATEFSGKSKDEGKAVSESKDNSEKSIDDESEKLGRKGQVDSEDVSERTPKSKGKTPPGVGSGGTRKMKGTEKTPKLKAGKKRRR